MRTERLLLVIFALLWLADFPEVGLGQDQPAGAVSEAGKPSEPDAQLQLYKEALTSKGSSEQMRINAANLLLYSKNPVARETLLAVLGQPENSPARAAVCRALSEARAQRRTIDKSEDFIPLLVELLRTEEEFGIAKLAAEATLLFEYEQVSRQIETMAKDSSLAARVRLNATYALKIQPDKRAIFTLMDLLDEADEQVAAASKSALESLHIPIGADAGSRKRVRSELQRKEVEEFLKDRLICQGTEMRKLTNELDWWKKQYLDSLDKIWLGITDDATKGRFLANHLASSEAMVRLWALDKVYEDRMSTTPRLAADLLGPLLIELISDEDKDVRLRTAKLLSLMGGLNSAEKLLEQLRSEGIDEVRKEMFVALGAAVSSALLSEPRNKIAPEIREETLEWAAEYLSEQDPDKSQKGAEVIKKLLERDGLTADEVVKYLGLLAKRYEQEKSDGRLRGELLIRMAGLCAQGSACKAEAARLYEPLFEKALDDETDFVREAAVDGLIYLGKTRVLIRKSALINDPSIDIRRRLISLLGEIGSKDDLAALWEKIGSSGESKAAWDAMLRIFRRSEAVVLSEWVDIFFNSAGNSECKLSDDQMLFFLLLAEQKAENRAEMLHIVRGKLADLYSKTGDFEQSAKYLGMLYQAAGSPEQKQEILPRLLDAYLRWPNVERAARIIDNCLLERDLEPNSPIVLVIDRYLSEPPVGAEPNAVLEDLIAKTNVPRNKPRLKWREQLKRWKSRLGWFRRPEDTEEVGKS
ncbi:MAG: HEAT repeat domain-containing protein [Planctomycetota bacterium]|jgi:HEAT repeat protein